MGHRNRSTKGDVVLPATRERREPVVGRRLIRLLEDQLRQLHHAPVHGNRTLLADHVVVAHLIAFFNPAVDSLRTVEDVFQNDTARQRMQLPRVPKSTLSDAQRMFDLSLLQPMVDDLVHRIGLLPHDARLDEITRKIVAVDASVFEVAGRIAWALPHNKNSARGAIQWCLHLDVLHGAPDGFTVIGGQHSERSQLPEAIKPNRLYLLDRAYQSYAHLDRVADVGSDFVVRLRHTAQFAVEQSLALSADDRRAGVQSDAVVTPAYPTTQLKTPVRLIEIVAEDNREPVRLLTNRMDLPAELIGLLYRHRWQIELFFRWIKSVTHLRHFLSESSTGMALQLYVAMIGTLLIALETDARPSKYDFAQMSLVAGGFLTLDEAKAVMAKRRAERARAAARQKERRARQQSAQ